MPFGLRQLDRILEIERASFGTEAWPRESFLEYYEDCRDLFFVVKSSGRIAGYVIGCVEAGRGEIASLAVHPDYRRRGLAGALIGRVLGDLRAAGIGRAELMVDWRQRNSTFFNALQVERNVMFLILTMIVLVAALNIISGLIMLVKDKGSDIAILRTMGASQGAIMRIFLITGAAIGVVGTVTGLFVGILICLNIESIRQFLSWLTNTDLFPRELYFLSKLPAEIDFGETSAVVIMALTLSFLATLYPSWRAARLDPVEALRYE